MNQKYDLALRLVQYIDKHLDRDTAHFRDKEGRLLLTLDEIVRSILDDEFEFVAD